VEQHNWNAVRIALLAVGQLGIALYSRPSVATSGIGRTRAQAVSDA